MVYCNTWPKCVLCQITKGLILVLLSEEVPQHKVIFILFTFKNDKGSTNYMHNYYSQTRHISYLVYMSFCIYALGQQLGLVSYSLEGHLNCDVCTLVERQLENKWYWVFPSLYHPARMGNADVLIKNIAAACSICNI